VKLWRTSVKAPTLARSADELRATFGRKVLFGDCCTVGRFATPGDRFGRNSYPTRKIHSRGVRLEEQGLSRTTRDSRYWNLDGAGHSVNRLACSYQILSIRRRNDEAGVARLAVGGVLRDQRLEFIRHDRRLDESRADDVVLICRQGNRRKDRDDRDDDHQLD